MSRRGIGFVLGVGVTFLAFVGSALGAAKSVSKNINDVKIKWRENCNAPVQELNLGNISITLEDTDANGTLTENGSSARMDATLTVAADAKTKAIWDCFDLCWFQVIYRNDWAAGKGPQYAGADVAVAADNPVVDPPNGGWDYMYLDGAARTMPNVTGPNYKYLLDDKPCYLTADGQAAFNVAKTTYATVDVPTDITDPANGQLKFSTYLVAEPKKTCDKPECLKPKQLLLLAGFDWTTSSDTSLLDINTTYIPKDSAFNDKTFVDKALSRATVGFPGYSSVEDGVICCPEPASLVLLVIGAGLARGLRRRAA